MSLQRDLRFSNLDDVLAELDRLESAEIQTVGKWSYYQILTHLGRAFDFSMTAYPRLLPVLVRRVIGPLAFRNMMRKGYMDPGNPNPDAPKTREEGDAASAARHLRSSIARFRTHAGPVAEHPFFGTLSKEDFGTLHAYHAALHLSFAHPDASVPRSAPGAVSSRGAVAARKQAKKKGVKKATQPVRKSGKKTARPVAKKTAKKAARKSAKKGSRR